MSRFHSYLSTANKLISTYKSGTPLTHHLKTFFSLDKKYGSRDRKMIGAICYHYFRCANLFKQNHSTNNCIIYSTFLCEFGENEFLKNISPELYERINLSTVEKLNYLKVNVDDFFAYTNEISDKIDKSKFALSFFQQPSLFLRIRPKKKVAVIDSLQKAKIAYELIGDNCLKFKNGLSLENQLRINRDVVVQDLNSQKVFDCLKEEEILPANQTAISVWDCCAASGGKSILLNDTLNGKIKLTVSDLRENILANLKIRLREAGINIQKKFVQDLSVASGLSPDEKFSIVICDAPCTGSGTWGRTPEQYFSFNKSSILNFTEKQQSILKNVIPHIEKNGLLIYITCSVLKAENEDMVKTIKDKFKLKVLEMNYLKGYESQADTMFVAVLRS